MSDTPLAPGWWQAGDGRWYPPPPGLYDGMPSRPPTSAPDRHPHDDAASGEPEPPLGARRGRTRAVVLGLLAVAVVIALVASLVVILPGGSTTTASAKDPNYQRVMGDLIESESTNLVFLETFWGGYSEFEQEMDASTPAERPAVARRWLSDIETQVAQFRVDLDQFEDTYLGRSFGAGTIPDEIRDLAIDHYRAWQRWASQIVTIANDWYGDRASNLSLFGYVTEVQPSLDIAIETTFTALCATLEETQPSDGSYVQLITDICSVQ